MKDVQEAKRRRSGRKSSVPFGPQSTPESSATEARPQRILARRRTRQYTSACAERSSPSIEGSSTGDALSKDAPAAEKSKPEATVVQPIVKPVVVSAAPTVDALPVQLCNPTRTSSGVFAIRPTRADSNSQRAYEPLNEDDTSLDETPSARLQMLSVRMFQLRHTTASVATTSVPSVSTVPARTDPVGSPRTIGTVAAVPLAANVYPFADAVPVVAADPAVTAVTVATTVPSVPTVARTDPVGSPRAIGSVAAVPQAANVYPFAAVPASTAIPAATVVPVAANVVPPIPAAADNDAEESLLVVDEKLTRTLNRKAEQRRRRQNLKSMGIVRTAPLSSRRQTIAANAYQSLPSDSNSSATDSSQQSSSGDSSLSIRRLDPRRQNAASTAPMDTGGDNATALGDLVSVATIAPRRQQLPLTPPQPLAVCPPPLPTCSVLPLPQVIARPQLLPLPQVQPQPHVLVVPPIAMRVSAQRRLTLPASAMATIRQARREHMRMQALINNAAMTAIDGTR